jgi:hypothetical protein
MYEELGTRGFTPITVAVDRSHEDARPWIEAARATHPSLIDPWHVVADLYNAVNVPTDVWIDERGRIVRPNDVGFGTDTFRSLTGIDSGRRLAALRGWLSGETPPLPDDRVRALQTPPRHEDQEARAEFALGRWLWERERRDAAARHWDRAGALAPHDFIIRRGTMPLRGVDPMGPEFRTMFAAWTEAGQPYYRPLAS